MMKEKGFTLIEMLVALGIFGVIIVIFAGLYGRFALAQREGAALQLVLEQTRTAFELMDREIRTGFGSTYVISGGQGTGVLFRNQNGDCVHYQWDNQTVNRAEVERGGTDCFEGDFAGAAYTPIIGADVQVSFMRFDATIANQVGGSLQNQGIVTIMAAITSGQTPSAPTVLQSSITSRQVIPYVES